MESLGINEKRFKSAYEIHSDYKNTFSLLSNSNVFSFLLFFDKNLFSIKTDILKELISDEVHTRDLAIETKQIQTKIVKDEFLEKYNLLNNKTNEFEDNEYIIKDKLRFQTNLISFNSSNNVYYCLDKVKHCRNSIEMKITMSVINISNDNGQTSEDFLSFGSNSSNESNNSDKPENNYAFIAINDDKNNEDNNKSNNKSEDMIISLNLTKINDSSCLLYVNIDSVSYLNFLNIKNRLYQDIKSNEFEKIIFSNIEILDNIKLYTTREITNSIIIKQKKDDLLEFITTKYCLKSCSNIIAVKEQEKVNINEDDSICFDFLASFKNEENTIKKVGLDTSEQLESNYIKNENTFDSKQIMTHFFMCFNLKKIGLSFTLLKMNVELDFDKKNEDVFKQINKWTLTTLIEILKLSSS